jgi:hypothetical protein
MDPDRIIRCAVTPKTTQCILGSPFEHQLTELATDEETEGEDIDPKVGEEMAKMSGRYGLWGDDPA